MTKIIEGIARAICESVGPEGSSDARSQMGEWPAWQDWEPQARAALNWLADNINDEMVFAAIAHENDPHIAKLREAFARPKHAETIARVRESIQRAIKAATG